jgi:hypothetical protein
MRWLLVLSLAGLAACSSGGGQPRAERALPEPITVSSPAHRAADAGLQSRQIPLHTGSAGPLLTGALTRGSR